MRGMKWFPAGFIALLFLWEVTAGAAHAQQAASAASINVRVEAVIQSIALYLARFVEAGAAIVIGIASMRALLAYFANLLGRSGDIPKEAIRLSLGRSLALALEFELGADILKTAVAPEWRDIGLLAAIAVLRTALNFFLERELRAAELRRGEPTASPPVQSS